MRVNFEEVGWDNQPTVIMIHGAGGSSATWTMQLRGLADRLHAVAVDLNGHGKSPDRGEADVTESYLDDISSVVSEFKSPILMGHSMGGALTQLYAIAHPEQLSGIVLVGTGCRLKVMQMVFDMLENDFEAYVEAVGVYMFHESASEELIAASKDEVRKCPPEIIHRDFDVCHCFDITETFNEIGLPTLIMVGRQDQMTPVKYSEFLHDRLENSELRIIENAGHSVMLERPEEFNRHLLDWIMSKGL